MVGNSVTDISILAVVIVEGVQGGQRNSPSFSPRKLKLRTRTDFLWENVSQVYLLLRRRKLKIINYLIGKCTLSSVISRLVHKLHKSMHYKLKKKYIFKILQNLPSMIISISTCKQKHMYQKKIIPSFKPNNSHFFFYLRLLQLI